MEPQRPADVDARIQEILLRGLPCRLRLVTKPWGWSCLEVEPLEGFTHLSTPEQMASFEDSGWAYHVTLGNQIPQDILDEVSARWHGAEVVLWVWRVNEWSCVARLDDRGVGACPWVLKAIELGDAKRAWFGPHVSM